MSRFLRCKSTLTPNLSKHENASVSGWNGPEKLNHSARVGQKKRRNTLCISRFFNAVMSKPRNQRYAMFTSISCSIRRSESIPYKNPIRRYFTSTTGSVMGRPLSRQVQAAKYKDSGAGGNGRLYEAAGCGRDRRASAAGTGRKN